MRTLSRRAMLQALAAQALAVRSAAGQTRRHGAPGPLSAAAETHDWTDFLGPSHNGVSTETHLSRVLPPPLVWELPKGTGYTSPAIAGDRLVFMHRLGDEEIVECLHPETGAPRWQFRYGTVYEDRYGYNNGPRSSPVIDAGRVYTVSAEGTIHCLALDTGDVVWRRDLRAEYRVPQDFFGTSSTPLVEGGLLVVNVGAPGGPCVAAFDTATGSEAWRAGTEWGPSYASPVPADIHGRRRVLVFAGGDSQPPTGGLLSIDPASGAIDFRFSFRGRVYESANASSPVVFDNKVFLTSSYRTGSVLVEILPDFTHRVAWQTARGRHPLQHRHPSRRLPVRLRRPQSGRRVAGVHRRGNRRRGLARRAGVAGGTLERNGRPQAQPMSTYRGSLLAADGQFLCLGELGHLLWLDLTPEGYTEIARAWLFASRESWGLPVLSRGLLYVTQNTRDLLTGAGPRLCCYDLRA